MKMRGEIMMKSFCKFLNKYFGNGMYFNPIVSHASLEGQWN